MYGADKQSWANVRTALRKGEAKDGDVTLILERRVTPDTAAAAVRSSQSNGSSNTTAAGQYSSNS